MRSRRPATSFGLAFSFLLASQAWASAQSDVQGVGTWRMNVAKSRIGPGQAPRSVVSTIEADGPHTKVTGVRVGADGIRTEAQFTVRFDGKDYPIKGSANADTVSFRRIDARTVERTDKRAGKVVETSTTVFSEDGKSSTTTGKARSARGEDFEFVVVNEKQ